MGRVVIGIGALGILLVSLLFVVDTVDNFFQKEKDRRKNLSRFSYNTGCIEATLYSCRFFDSQRNEAKYIRCLEDGEVHCAEASVIFSEWVFFQ